MILLAIGAAGAPAPAVAGPGSPTANLLVAHTELAYTWNNSAVGNGCSLSTYAGTPNGQFGDYSRVDWEGWAGCGAGGPLARVSTSTEFRDAVGNVLATGPYSAGNGWTADSSGSYQGLPAQSGRVYTINQAAVFELPHQPNTGFWDDAPGCSRSADQTTASCNVTSAFYVGPDPPSSSCLSWPAPMWCSFNPPPTTGYPFTAGPSLYGVPKDGETVTAYPGYWCNTVATSTSPFLVQQLIPGTCGNAVSATYDWYRCSPSGSGCTLIVADPPSPAELANPDAVSKQVHVPCTNCVSARSAPAGGTGGGWRYQAGHADVGKTLKARITVYGPGGTATVDTPLSGVVAALSPINKTAPMIAGVPQEGNTLVSDVGEWDGSPTLDYAYQWQRCASGCVDISGATAPSYILTSADVGSTIRLRVTGTNSAGSLVAFSSQSPAIQTGFVAPSNTSPPTISGTAQDGQTLTASPGSWTRSPVTYVYQWQRCPSGAGCADIPGAKQQTYTAGHDDVGATLIVVVTAANTGGTSQPAPSAPTVAVAALAPTNRAPPVVAGVPVSGQTLRTTDGVWDGTPPTFAYQWRRCDTSGNNCSSIAPATDQTYTATSSDEGYTLEASVTATNQAGSASATSQPSAPVQRSPLAPCGPGQVGSGTACITPPPPPQTCPSGQVGVVPACVTPPPPPGSCPSGQVGTPPVCAGPPPPPGSCPSGQVGAPPVCTAPPPPPGSCPVDQLGVPPFCVTPPQLGNGSPPSNRVQPEIAGVAREGRSVTAVAGNWDGATPMNFAYQWRRCDTGASSCTDIAGASGQTYVVDHQDVGATLRVRVTATNSSGSATKDSDPTPTVDGRFPAAASVSSPTGPVAVPGAGAFDPISSGRGENLASVSQPDPSLPPIYGGAFDPPGAGQKFNAQMTGSTPDPLFFGQVAMGKDKAYVADGGSVYMYNAIDQTYLGTFQTSLGSPLKIAYYRGEVFVYSRANREFDVFDADGNFQRRLPVSLPSLPNPGGSPEYGGIAVSWGEIWATRYGCDHSGAMIDLFDTQSGAYKGTIYSAPRLADMVEKKATDDKSTIANTDVFNCTGDDQWWDISVVPELDAAITNYRVVNRNPVLSMLSLPDPQSLLPHQPLTGTSGGTDEVWGMRWLLTAPTTPGTDSSPPKFGTNITEYSLDRDGQTGFTTSTPKRSWTPKQPDVISDIGYRHHDPEIVARGPLMQHDWINGTQCLDYVITDGDFYLIGRDGEHWYNQAAGVQSVTVKIDDQTVATSSQASSVCTPRGPSSMLIDTNQVPSGHHVLTITASVAGTTLTKANAGLRIDHDNPVGSLNALPAYVRSNVTVTGTMTDTHSGPGDWQLQVSPQGQNAWSDAGGCSLQASADPTGAFSCSWDTKSVADGVYDLRARLRDRVGNVGPNTAYSPVASTTVDNTPPTVANTAPDINETTYEEVPAPTTSIDWTQTDNPGGSGVNQTTIYVNTATDGSDSGAWAPTGSSSATGDAHTSWDTTQQDGGLHRLRADACDQAGNCSRTEWQAVIASRTRRFPQCLENDSGHCYAGEKLGYANPFDPTGPGLGYAIQTNLTTPAPVAHQTATEFSGNYINLGGGATLQVGLVTPSPRSDAENACGRVSSGPTDPWYQYIELTRGTKGFIYCPRRPATKGETHSYKVEITKPESTYYARGSWDGVVQAIRVLGSRRVYWLGSRGTSDLQAAGEATNRSRELAGRYTGLQVWEGLGQVLLTRTTRLRSVTSASSGTVRPRTSA